MRAKWDAKCDTKFQYLWLRNGIFYHRIELPRVDGKRRYKRISLHTGNFYEAREKIRIMNNNSNWPFDDLRKLLNGLIFEIGTENSESVGLISKFKDRGRLSKLNKRTDLRNYCY